MKIYCSGIGGIGLSAYASLQRVAGHDVSGSDRAASALIEDLRSQGIIVTLDQSGAAVPDNADLFVYSEAIPPSAPERMRAQELGIRQVSYPQAVGELARKKRLIAVCGTHGKSSTTAMAAKLLIEAGLDPTVVVGTKLRELGGRNWRKGSSDIFLLEACEYRHSFFHYAPSVILLTTCDGDHFDFYKTIEEYRDAFAQFIRKLPPDGLLITHGGDPDCVAVAQLAGRAFTDADRIPMIALKTPGEHMQRNAQLVLALAQLLNIPAEKAASIVSQYAGSWRRMEVKGAYRGDVTVIDDYAHHPREIRATLQGMRSAYPDRRLVVAFQPHTHERTLTLYDDFTKAFSDADLLLVADVYEARSDIEKGKVDMHAFVMDIAEKSHVDVLAAGSLSAVEKHLKNGILKSNDVLICMGAGTITDVAASLAAKV